MSIWVFLLRENSLCALYWIWSFRFLILYFQKMCLCSIGKEISLCVFYKIWRNGTNQQPPHGTCNLLIGILYPIGIYKLDVHFIHLLTNEIFSTFICWWNTLIQKYNYRIRSLWKVRRMGFLNIKIIHEKTVFTRLTSHGSWWWCTQPGMRIFHEFGLKMKIILCISFDFKTILLYTDIG